MLTAKGDLGIVKVGYQRVITLTRWQLTCPKDTLGEPVSTIEARVDATNSVWIGTPPTALGLWMGESWWVWDRVQVTSTVNVGSKAEFRIMGNPEVRINF